MSLTAFTAAEAGWDDTADDADAELAGAGAGAGVAHAVNAIATISNRIKYLACIFPLLGKVRSDLIGIDLQFTILDLRVSSKTKRFIRLSYTAPPSMGLSLA
jgi:hypothetical protein